MKQNYNLPTTNENSTFNGLTFSLPNQVKYDLTNAVARINIEKKGIVFKQYSTADNTLTLTLPYSIVMPEHLVDISADTYEWDLKIVFADGRQKTYIGGKWQIDPIITE